MCVRAQEVERVLACSTTSLAGERIFSFHTILVQNHMRMGHSVLLPVPKENTCIRRFEFFKIDPWDVLYSVAEYAQALTLSATPHAESNQCT
jgi:hypothetical protein